MIKIRAFRAIDDITSCEKYAEGHIQVLKSYNIPIIKSASTEWFFNPDVYVLSVEDEAGKIVGGAKIHVANLKFQLPVEISLSPIDCNISEFVKSNIHNGIGEMCGLWNAKEVTGKGYSVLLTEACVAEAGIALAYKLKLQSLFVLCAPWTTKIVEDVGFEKEVRVGNQGTFPYPKPDLLATLYVIEDIEQLKKAAPMSRSRIIDLRQKPKQKRVERYKDYNLEIEYDLIVENWKQKINYE